MSMSEKENVKPLVAGDLLLRTAPEDAIGVESRGDVEVAVVDKPSKRRRCVVRCCACCGVTVVVLGLVILILALTVFKVKDPVLTINSITVEDTKLGFGEKETRPVSINATVTADISLKNPNAVSLRFKNSTTIFYHREQALGVAYAPSGNARARRTVRMNVTVDMFAERVIWLAMAFPNATFDAVSGNPISIDLRSYTNVKGRVNVWGIYKRNLDIRANCSMTLVYEMNRRQDITNRVCKATVK